MKIVQRNLFTILLVSLAVVLAGCSGGAANRETAVTNPESKIEILTLPTLAAANLDNAPLGVIASTSIIGDVVAQVGGEAIDLTTLMAAGQDPHSYEPGAQELTAVAQANVIFINGWDLEEALVHDLETIGEDVPVIAISANISPLAISNDAAEHDHSGADPHVWFNIQNVVQWTENVAQILATLDPANAVAYQSNAQAYLAQLAELETDVETQMAMLPQERRLLVTNHNSFSYFAQAYDFEILGTVFPSNSSLSAPSASDLVSLIKTMAEHGICTLFTETAVSDSLAQTIAAELTACDTVHVVPLYTGAVGPVGSNADSYIGMFRANVEAIVLGLE